MQSITQAPSFENGKSFMVFDGEPCPENMLFDGTCEMFADCFFSNAEWEVITSWAAREGYQLVTQNSPEYKEIQEMYE